MSGDLNPKSNDPFSGSQHSAPHHSSPHNPFSQPPAMRQPDPPTNTPWGKIFLAVAAFCLLFCGGIGGLVYFGLQSFLSPNTVELPSRPETMAGAFEADAAEFNRILSKTETGEAIPASIHAVVLQAMNAASRGQPIPFDHQQFIAAINNSPEVGSPLDYIDRISISQWLEEAVPTPNKLDDYYEIVDVDFSSDKQLATVSLIFYSETSQPDSQQWFLVSDGVNWKIYDWVCLEFGRRMSDEYASYLRGSAAIAPGYDQAVEAISNAYTLADAADIEATIKLLKRAESIPMLNQDRDLVRLRIAYTYMAIERYDLAIKVLQRIRAPDQMWGPYPVLAICYLNVDQLDLAMETAKKAESQSPNHPRSHWLMSVLLEAFDEPEKSAQRAVLALAGCPQDQTMISRVIAHRRPQDIATLIRAAEINGPTAFNTLAESTYFDVDWATALIDAVIENTDSVEMPSGFLQLLKGNRAWAKDDFDEAAELYLAAKKLAIDDTIRDNASTSHIDSRVENDRYVELFDESDDLVNTIRKIATEAFEGEFYGDANQLLQSIQQTPSLTKAASSSGGSSALANWTGGIAGWCRHQIGDDQTASRDLIAFLKWRGTLPPDSDASDAWLDDGVRTTLAQAMINIGDIDGLLAILPNWTPVQNIVVAHARRVGADACRDMIDSYQSSEQPMMRLLCARLHAVSLSLAGDAAAADAWHVKAFQIVDTFDWNVIDQGGVDWGGEEMDDAAILRRTLSSERAGDLVWNRVGPNQIDLPLDTEPSQDLIVDVVSAAVPLQDSVMFRAWTRPTMIAGLDADRKRSLDLDRYQYFVDRGRYEDAADVYRSVKQKEDSGVDDFKIGLRQLALLKSKRFDKVISEAKRLAANLDSQDDKDSNADGKKLIHQNPLAKANALVALASSNADLLDSVSSTCETDDMTSWLSYSAPIELLDRNMDDPSIASILHRHPLWLRYRSSAASGRLLVERDRTFDQEFIKSSVAKSLGGSIDVSPIRSDTALEDAKTWLVVSASGRRLLIDMRPRKMPFSGLPAAIGDRAGTEIQSLSIAVLGEDILPERILFKTARALAESIGTDAVAFQWSDQSLIWCQSATSPLAKQIHWTDRAPVSNQTIRHTLFYRDTEDPAADEFRGTDQWEETLKASGDPIDVTLMVQVDDIFEAIPARLIDVDADQYGLLVKPKVASRLNRLVDPRFPIKVIATRVRAIE